MSESQGRQAHRCDLANPCPDDDDDDKEEEEEEEAHPKPGPSGHI